jgi:PAS domain S-box-containing protein
MSAHGVGKAERSTADYVRLLVERVPSMLAYWDRDLLCRYANPAYARWFGVDPQRLVGTSLSGLLGPALFAKNEPYIRAALRGEQQVFERVVPGPGGVNRHSLATYIPDIVDGRTLGFIAHVTEVSPLKDTEERLRSEIAQRERANELLRRSESALREAQRLGRIGSWDWAFNQERMEWSEEMYRIYGRDPAQPPPTYLELEALYTPESWTRLLDAISMSIESGKPFQIEAEYRRPDGGTGWVEARGEAVRDADGKIERFRGTVLEITPRRQMEQARIRQQVAEAANRNKTALLSWVSHDMRTPLNGILGVAQLCLADPSLAPKHREWSEIVLRSGQHMLELVDEFLDLAAAEAGQIALRASEFDLLALLRDSLTQAGHAARERGPIELTGPPADAPPIVMVGDPKRIKQVIDNLLSNAVKYTPVGGAVAAGATVHGETVELVVRDTGIGISADQAQNLFVAFERLGAERRGIAGTGLGLAFTKRIVELMGGRIEVHSRPGEGSEFRVELPRVRR